MDRLRIVVEDPAVMATRAVWRQRQHELRWREFANESDYNRYRAEQRQQLLRTQWLPQVTGLPATKLAHMPTGMLADLYPLVAQYGPQADAWQAWNRQLGEVFEALSSTPGHRRQNFINDFISLYAGRIRLLDPQAETLVFEGYRDTYETAGAYARTNLQPTSFVSRTLPQMKLNMWDRWLRAYECGSELILLGDLLVESNPRWERSLRAHRSFMRKLRHELGLGR